MNHKGESPAHHHRATFPRATPTRGTDLMVAFGSWVSLMWLGHIPWASRRWDLPFLTVLAPSERYYQERGRPHKKVTEWARQMVLLVLQLRRWLPGRPLVLVGDSGYAVLDLLHLCQSLSEPVTLLSRLRLDAGLYAPAPPREAGRMGRPRVKGPRLPTLRLEISPRRMVPQPHCPPT